MEGVLELLELLQGEAVAGAGVFGRSEVGRQGGDFLEAGSFVAVLLFHHVDGVEDGAAME